jgi:hypothetical protein
MDAAALKHFNSITAHYDCVHAPELARSVACSTNPTNEPPLGIEDAKPIVGPIRNDHASVGIGCDDSDTCKGVLFGHLASDGDL